MRRLMLCSAVALLLVPSFAAACSQCQCGMPFPPDALGGPAPSRVRVGADERFFSKQNALEGAPGLEKEQEHHIGLWAVARAGSNVSLLARLPYVYKKITAEPTNDVSSFEKNDGLGDAELNALVKLHEFALGGDRRALLSGVVGTRIPTGQSDAQDETGARLDEHLQTGTGAWSGLAGLDLNAMLPAGRFDVGAAWRGNGENSHGYRYGDVWLYNAGLARRVGSVLELSLQANGRVAKQDRLEDGSLGENTGGHVLYASPVVRWFAGGGVLVEASAQFPVTSALKGEQEEHSTARIAVSLAR